MNSRKPGVRSQESEVRNKNLTLTPESEFLTPDAGRRTPASNKVVAILLAAGRSRRMGAFKPLLPVVEACINHLFEGGVEDVCVVVGHRAAEMRERLAHLPVRFAFNDEAESEMSVSIARGVECVPAEAGAMLVALCDQPMIPSSVVSHLIEQWRQTDAPTCGVWLSLLPSLSATWIRGKITSVCTVKSSASLRRMHESASGCKDT